MSDHPYRGLDASAFWRRAVAEVMPSDVDPVGSAKFSLRPVDRVATAGSCFAQHIARYLAGAGFNYLVTETAHPLMPDHIAAEYSYGLFSARYANIYTVRQLVQLFKRAYGLFVPTEDSWDGQNGTLIDPFRPQIQPLGFATRTEFYADRAQHFAAVREMVETLDHFVFTLGLTEAWMSRDDGAVFPLCPGTAGGVFLPERHVFHNFTVRETLDDLAEMHAFILARNPRAKIILTVSPVPLVATASGAHVLSATTYSKAVLRAAAGEYAGCHADVAYFPSFEIITGNFNGGAYYADDLRSIREEGVAHVMRLFLRHYAGAADEAGKPPSLERPDGARKRGDDRAMVSAVCDEETLARFVDA